MSINSTAVRMSIIIGSQQYNHQTNKLVLGNILLSAWVYHGFCMGIVAMLGIIDLPNVAYQVVEITNLRAISFSNSVNWMKLKRNVPAVHAFRMIFHANECGNSSVVQCKWNSFWEMFHRISESIEFQRINQCTLAKPNKQIFIDKRGRISF